MKLPVDFDVQMRTLLGEEAFSALAASLDGAAEVAFRPNRGKGALAVDGLESVPWSSVGKYLSQRYSFTFDPLFHAGVYYVQEPSSMFLEQALRQCGHPHRVLDLCASPGGKSTLLRSLLPDDVLLVSNEPVKVRAQVLLENLLKWGHASVVVTNGYPKDFAPLSGFFDVVVTDVPCSGEGMFRKDNPAVSEWSSVNVKKCAIRQFEIVSEVWPSLRDGGFLVYSTCTYNLEEDERNVERICRELGAEVVEIPVDDAWNITGNLLPGASFPVYHFMPHRTRGEGFFLALLRKKASDGVRPMHLKKQKPLVALKKDFRKLLDMDNSLVQWEKDDVVYAVPEMWSSDFQSLSVVSHVLSAGIPLVQRKGNKYFPHHALAMSRHLNRAAFPSFGIDRDMALDYLRRLSLVLPAGVERSCVILQYQGFPLGFVNNLGSHANNLYPQNWKIRSGYTADIVNDFIVPF